MINPELAFEFDSVVTEGDAFLARWRVPAELPYLEGHFPGAPVLPAVAILDATLEVLRRAGRAAVLRSLKSAKFTRPIVPGDSVEIRITDGWRAEWRVAGALVAELVGS